MENVKIYSYTIVRFASTDFADKVPYCSGIVEFSNGDRKAALIVGYEEGMDINIGQEVKFLGKGEDGLLKYSFI